MYNPSTHGQDRLRKQDGQSPESEGREKKTRVSEPTESLNTGFREL